MLRLGLLILSVILLGAQPPPSSRPADEVVRGPSEEAVPGPPDKVVRGRPTVVQHEHGAYVRYVPRAMTKEKPYRLLVLIHGSIAEGDSAIDAAQTYAKRWIDLAERKRLVILAPAFDQENFGGHAGPGGGYRGLFGRKIGADEFLNAVVDATRATLQTLDDRFYLYGHSAGGQFVSRYIVMHPERVKSAVICAAGTFAFPDANTPWTNGMKPLKRRMRWGDNEPWREIEIAPDPKGWLAATQIPITVIVGARDTAPIKPLPGNPGVTHVERARHWVRAMEAFARAHGKTARVRFIEVKDVGHNSARLTPACQDAIRAGQ